MPITRSIPSAKGDCRKKNCNEAAQRTEGNLKVATLAIVFVPIDRVIVPRKSCSRARNCKKVVAGLGIVQLHADLAVSLS